VTTCQAGSCAPVTPQNCPPPTACHLNGRIGRHPLRQRADVLRRLLPAGRSVRR
jgi:hypothetical protein